MFFAFGPDDFSHRVPEDIRKFLQKDAISWIQMEQLLLNFREKRPDITIGAFLTFLFIARRSASSNNSATSNLTITYLADQLKLSYPTAARHCDMLSNGIRGKPGLNWILKKRLEDQRSKCVMISDEGILILSDAIRTISR